MVSLSRLLAAADDSLPEEPAASPHPTRPPRDCVLPPALPPDAVPRRLRLAESLRSQAPAHPTPSSTSSASLSSLRPPPLLPLQRLLRDLGPEATAPANMSALARTLAHFGRPSEPAVASALLFLATAVPSDSTTVDSHTMFQLFALFCGDPDNPSFDPAVQQAIAAGNPAPSEWRASVLVQAVTIVASQFNAPLDWRLVIRSLDVEGLETQLTQSAFVEIANAYIAGTKGSRLPADCILDSWNHAPAQLCMVSHALRSPSFINWEVLELFDGATPDDGESPYARVRLIEKLVELDARDLLQIAIKESAEIVLLSLTCSKPRSNTALQQKLTVTLLTPLIAIFPASEKALRQMWHVTPALVEAGIINMWKKDGSTLRKALSIGIDMAILPDMLSSGSSIEFALELAMLAYQEDVLKFESWLMELLRARGVQSISTLTIYMAQKIRRGDHLAAASLSLDALRIVFRCLITSVRASAGTQTQDLMDGVQNVYESYCKLNTRMLDLSPSSDVGNPKVLFGSEVPPVSVPPATAQQAAHSSLPKDTSTSSSEAASTAAAMLLPQSTNADGGPTAFPAAVENEADVYFGKLYKGEMPTESAVDILRRLKASNSEHDRQVFNCTVHTLFDEYRFFKKYPDRELKITGVLFGSLVQFSLLSGGLLGLAARCVLDALRTVEPSPQPIGRLTKFGLVALERYKTRLHEWPQYCAHILELPRLKELAPELIGDVQKALDMNGAVIPSAAEKKIGLAVFERETPNEPVMTTDGGVPPVSSVRDAAADADAVRALVASPPMSTNNTPMKGRSVSSSSLRSSPPPGADGSLGMSPLDLPSLLGMTREEASQVIAPDEVTQDKMKFIFNNLSQTMMDDKVEEMLAILSPEYYRYFSVYIVVKRASSEANFHHLYLAMLTRMEPHVPSLFPMVFQTTYRRVKVLLAGDKSTASTDRTILKSLGSWIGSLTLARNRSILRRDLDLKEALMDAYSNGRLTTVIPFVVKVLEHCQQSKIFKTTNPWVRGVLSLMKEIYGVEDLKLNMKFELQILSKHLGIDVESIAPSNLLRSRPAPDKTHNPDFAAKKSVSSSPPRTSPSPTASPSPELRRSFGAQAVGARPGAPIFSLTDNHTSAPGIQAPVTAGPASSTGRIEMQPSLVPSSLTGMGTDSVGDISSILASTAITSNAVSSAQTQRNPLHASVAMGSVHSTGTPLRSGTSLGPSDSLLPNLAQYITVSPSLVLFQTHPNLKRMIPIAIDRAIREIIQPVVERSCAIAFLTTKELTLKDFANEPDMVKIRRAALQMVQQLAGSLALVTSKEPLRVSMGNQLRTILTPSVVADQSLVEQTAQVVCAANLEVGCAVIEKHAKEKAARDLNEKIGPTFAARRPQHSAYNFGMGPGPEVLRVYDEFSRIHRGGVLPTQYTGAPQTQASPSSSQPVHPTLVASQPAPAPSMPSLNQVTSRATQPSTDFRQNGSAPDPKPDGRAPSTQQVSRLPGATQGRSDEVPPIAVGGRRVPESPTAQEEGVAISVYGNPLPQMASPAAVATVLMTAAGSANGNGGVNSQGLPSTANASAGPGEEALSTQQVLERFNGIYPQLTARITDIVSSSTSSDVTLADVPSDDEVHSLWIQIPAAVKRSVTADEAGMAVAQKVFHRLYDGDSSVYREIHVMILEGLRESCRKLPRELSTWLNYSEDAKKLHRECTIALLRSGSLLQKTFYDDTVAKAIDNGRNVAALEFACFLVRRAVIEEPLATAAELYLTLEAMAKVAKRSNPPTLTSAPDGLEALVEAARSVVHNPTTGASSNVGNSDGHHTTSSRQQKEAEPTDPAGARDFVANVLIDWHRILASDSPGRPISDHTIVSFLTQVRTAAMNNDDAKERFFRLAVEMVSAVTSTALHSQSGARGVPDDLTHSPYTAVEAAVRLVVAISRRESMQPNESVGRGAGTLCQFLVALVRDILKSGAGADLRPHFRMFACLISELSLGATLKEQTGGEFAPSEPDATSVAFADRLHNFSSTSEALNFLEDKNAGFVACVWSATGNSRADGVANLDNMHVLKALVGALSACAPKAVPGFSFSWLQLISNKELLPSLLSLSNVHGWPLFKHLLLSMLDFLSEFLRDAEEPLTQGIRTLYSGMLRVLLVLLHDFPEFLCAYHMSFCDAIPQNCVQLRNLILASFPKDMRLPDPFLPELNVDELPDMLRQPVILSDFTSPLELSGLRAVVDNYLQSAVALRGTRPQGELESYLIEVDSATGSRSYNTRTIGALVLYLGQFAVSRVPEGEAAVLKGPATDLVRLLTNELGPEGQHHLFNAIANQLRYPNNNTMYYSNVLLLLFHEASSDSVKEQITRVLVERLIANRPHPWGLLITFVQLIKNSEYNFWGHSFVRCAPEIEQLFENVAKFCVGPVLQNKHQSIVAAS